MVCILFLFLFVTNFVQNEAESLGNQWDSIQEMNAFFEEHFARENQTTLEQWNSALPTDAERSDISGLVLYLMSLETFDKFDRQAILEVYPAINSYINISLFDVSGLFKAQVFKRFTE